MNTATKVVLVIGTLLVVIGIGAFALGAGGISELEDDWNNFEVEGENNGTLEVEDKDGKGDMGFTFWVKGKYLDENNNNIWDVCENTNITIISKPQTNPTWDGDLDGDFYYEVDYAGNGNVSNCDAVIENIDNSREDKGLVKIGRACLACYSGEIVFQSNQEVWVTNDDTVTEELTESFGVIALGFIGGFGGICCGVIFLIIGLIMALTMKDDKVQEMMFTPPADNQMLSAQTAVSTPNKTHMSQPDFGDKT